MKNLKTVLSDATEQINKAHDNVTLYVRKVLKNAGIPKDMADKYSATYCAGGEWILDDDNELAAQDIHLLSDDYIVETVREIENIN